MTFARFLKLGIRRGQPPVSDREMKFTGERFVPGKAEFLHLYQEHMVRYMFATQLTKKKRVLDLGCGCGYGSYYVAKKGASTVIGVDRSDEAIEFSRRRFAANNLTFLLADARNLPFSSMRFDVVTAFELIEHIKDYSEMLKEAKRLLTRNGILVLSTPNKETYKTKDEFHIKEFTLEELRKTLGRFFKHVKIMSQEYPSGLAIRSTTTFAKTDSDVDEIEAKALPRLSAGKTDTLYFVVVCSQRSLRNIREFLYLFSSKSHLLQSLEQLSRLQNEFEDRTKWALKLRKELRERAATIAQLRKEFEDRTKWALKLQEELKQRDETILKLQWAIKIQTIFEKVTRRSSS